MKKLLIVVLSAGLALGASAQHAGHVIHGGGFSYRPHVTVGVGYGYGFGYGPFFPYYGFGYGPWGYPYPPYYYGYGAMPGQLTYQIDGIKTDYKQQIKDTRHDKALTHKEKRQKIDQLKRDRDQAVVQARKDYYYNSRRNYNNRNNGNNNNGNNNNGNNNNGKNENNGNGNNGNSQNNNYNQ